MVFIVAIEQHLIILFVESQNIL